MVTVAAGLAAGANAEVVAHFDMRLDSGKITETVSGSQFAVEGNFAPENVDGAVGDAALRFDGYTSRVVARLGDILPSGTDAVTVSLWVAVPCYPVIQIDTDTSEKTPIVTCLDKDKKRDSVFILGTMENIVSELMSAVGRLASMSTRSCPRISGTIWWLWLTAATVW